MKILALEPYYGGSHRAFLDDWSSTGRHEWTILGLPARKWKWRMRHGAITLADQARTAIAGGEKYDLLFCSDMLNLAEFRGLVGQPLSLLPAIAYFHENQLTYPVQVPDERDLNYGMINFTTALAATQVWFNSAFHRDSFLAGLSRMLGRMPDQNCLEKIDLIRSRSLVFPQGIGEMPPRPSRPPGPPRILWAARWEFDKNPELFLEAMVRLKDAGVDFRLDVIGQQFSRVPPIFAEARERLSDRIDRWGCQKSREDYQRALLEADTVVSTSDHEFFGVTMVEAAAAGAFPLLPNRLAYPEIFRADHVENGEDFFYDGSLDNLIDRLRELIGRTEQGELWGNYPRRGIRAVERYYWRNLAPRLDEALEQAHLTP